MASNRKHETARLGLLAETELGAPESLVPISAANDALLTPLAYYGAAVVLVGDIRQRPPDVPSRRVKEMLEGVSGSRSRRSTARRGYVRALIMSPRPSHQSG